MVSDPDHKIPALTEDEQLRKHLLDLLCGPYLLTAEDDWFEECGKADDGRARAEPTNFRASGS